MGKGVRHVYNHIQSNWPYPTPNTTYSIPQHYLNMIDHVSTVSIISERRYMIQTNIPNTKTRLHTDMQIDEKLNSFETPIKINQSKTQHHATNNVSGKVHLGFDQLQSQLEPNNHTNNMKLPPSGKCYSCF